MTLITTYTTGTTQGWTPCSISAINTKYLHTKLFAYYNIKRLSRMAILRRFRKSLRIEKNKDTLDSSNLAEPEAPICHSCGQRTPQRSTFSSFSSRGTSSSSPDDIVDHSSSPPSMMWQRPIDYQRSDSGYESVSTNTTSASIGLSPKATRSSSSRFHNNYDYEPVSTFDSHDNNNNGAYYDPPVSMFPKPTRQMTYSSSVYSHDDEEETEAFPPLPVMVEEEPPSPPPPSNHYDMFTPPPRKLSNYSTKFTQPVTKSRYARLNDLPVESPRASMFPDDMNDGSDELSRSDSSSGGSSHDSAEKKRRTRKWTTTGRKSLSVSVLPAQFRRLSSGRKDAPQQVQAQES